MAQSSSNTPDMNSSSTFSLANMGVCVCVELCAIPMPRLRAKERRRENREGKHLWMDRARTSFTSALSHPASLFLSLTFSSPLTLVLPLSVPLSNLSPAVRQPPVVLPAVFPLGTRNANKNKGQGSRERTGCTYNGPVVPTKTIIPFFPSLAFLSCCQDLWDWKRHKSKERWMRRGWGERDGFCFGRQPQRHLPLYFHYLKDQNGKHTLTHSFSCSQLSLFAHCPPALCLSQEPSFSTMSTQRWNKSLLPESNVNFCCLSGDINCVGTLPEFEQKCW